MKSYIIWGIVIVYILLIIGTFVTGIISIVKVRDVTDEFCIDKGHETSVESEENSLIKCFGNNAFIYYSDELKTHYETLRIFSVIVFMVLIVGASILLFMR